MKAKTRKTTAKRRKAPARPRKRASKSTTPAVETRPATLAELVTGRARGPGRLQRPTIPEHVRAILRAGHARTAKRTPFGDWLFYDAAGHQVDGSWNVAQHRARAVRWMQASERLYRESRNPLFAWEALGIARVAGLSVPEWVLEYLARGAATLHELTRAGREPPRVPATAVYDALEFKQPGSRGPGSPFSRYRDLAEPVMIAARVDWYLRGGFNTHNAVKLAARDEAVSKASVRRAWLQHAKAFSGSRRKTPQ